MRHPVSRGLIRAAGVVLGALSIGLQGACGDEPPAPVDDLLRDSLGLAADAPVRTVRLFHADGGERLEPDSMVIEPGVWADFRSDDPRPRAIRFERDSVSPAARGFLAQRGQGNSPPLLAEGAHWLVDFSEAPPGRYPFVVEGTGAPARGIVIVRLPPTSR